MAVLDDELMDLNEEIAMVAEMAKSKALKPLEMPQTSSETNPKMARGPDDVARVR